jgi:hypothetical protein
LYFLELILFSFVTEDNADVQAEEIEALQAIFPDEFELVSHSPPYKYKILIVPDPSGSDKDNHGIFLCIAIFNGIILSCSVNKPSLRYITRVSQRRSGMLLV